MKKWLLILLFGTMVCGAPTPAVEHAGTEEDPICVYNSPTLRIQCDAYEVVLTKISVQVEHKNADGVWGLVLVEAVAGVMQPGGTPTIMLYEKLKTVPDGLLRFRMQARAENGMTSEWSEWLYGTKTWEHPPPKPTGCKLIQ